ncbi:MAG: hypothetical protein R3B84_17600 [Zavarzinella sp.]
MANTEKISLAKALKLKNRLVGQISKLTQDVQLYNSTQEGSEAIDVRARFELRAQTVATLTQLKYAIYLANQPVQNLIFELAERKAEVALLSGLSTKHGVYKEGYPTAGDINYLAQFRKADIDAMVKKLEYQIDLLQDRLDVHNHQTTVEVDSAVLAQEIDA